ncbi:hypothetical protein EST38_g650 [Candolleomyces aberdarensis]|uniref:Uncharacterized protein n=1 Tax=Candolleomyces aberdarensis TaxID=2316362 RepID=A0A4Q2DZC9_9AGAR|nr:hypothetical protein EST38_g650 [Candolleomyces aberdarensis]
MLPDLQTVNDVYYPRGTIPSGCNFHTYAKRVRALNLRPDPTKSRSTPSISPYTYVFIASELEGRPLFPGLQEIAMQTAADPTDEFACIPLIFTSSVQEVAFQGQGLSNRLFGSHCLPLLGQRLSSLRRLALSSDRQDVEPSTFDAIVQLTLLESLDIRLPQSKHFKPEFLVKAGKTLKKLSSLTIDLHSSSHEVPFGAFPPRVGPSGPDSTLFPNLMSVHAVSRSGGKLCGCIPPFLLENIKSLTLIVQVSILSEFYFKEALDTLETIQCLQKVEILNQEGSKVYLVADTIIPFLGRLNLSDFKLGVDRIKYQKQLAFQPLIKAAFKPGGKPLHPALPGPRSLVLPEAIEGSHCPTLACLSHIAQSANGMQMLVVGLKSINLRESFWGSMAETVGNLLAEWKNRRPSESTLQFLAIKELRSPLSFTTQEYNDIAQLLDLMFPHLISIKPYCEAHENEPYWKDHWWFIEHLRRMYQELRMYRPAH